MNQIRGPLGHEAWDNILNDGEPHTAASKNRTLSNKLTRCLNACMHDGHCWRHGWWN
jgi:hypothetical protein